MNPFPHSDPTTHGNSGLHLVLVRPEIPWNTGNLGRTCLALGARLHLVGPLGFSLSNRGVRRAGLDYWSRVDLVLWNNWETASKELEKIGQLWFFAPSRGMSLFRAPIELPAVLVFGSESHGLDPELLERHSNRVVQIPILPGAIRSLNLSTAAAIAGFEVARRNGSLDP